MNVNPTDVIGITVSGAIALNLLWKLLCYEFRIHTASNYVVKIRYKIADTSIEDVAKYAVKAYSANDAYIRAMKRFMNVRKIGDVQRTEVIKVD